MRKQEDDPLKKYFSIIEGKLKPNYLKCKSIPVDIALNSSEEELWKEHDDKMNDFYRNHRCEGVKTSLLDLKIEIAKRILMHCSFCERRCGVNRMEGKKGHCGVVNYPTAKACGFPASSSHPSDWLSTLPRPYRLRAKLTGLHRRFQLRIRTVPALSITE